MPDELTLLSQTQAVGRSLILEKCRAVPPTITNPVSVLEILQIKFCRPGRSLVMQLDVEQSLTEELLPCNSADKDNTVDLTEVRRGKVCKAVGRSPAIELASCID